MSVLVRQRGGKTRRAQKLQVFMEISGRDVHVLLVDRSGSQPALRVYSLPWRQEETPLARNNRSSLGELTSVLQALVVREKLHGASVRLAISGDFCVTRILSGTKEHVRQQLQSLADRCALYLSLGSGENTFAEASRPLDAKHEVAWVTVANERTLRSLVAAVENAGLQVASMEHSLVAIARTLGQLHQDEQEPVVVLDITRRGVDVGISFQGQLLLDYRPGGLATKERVAEILVKHLKRLQRFCNRRFSFAKGRLRRVFLCGNLDDVQQIMGQFSPHSDLAVCAVQPAELLAQLGNSDAPQIHAEHAAIAGLLAFALDPVSSPPAPDFMRQWSSQAQEPLWPATARLCWPMAAAMLGALAILGAAFYQHARCHALERNLRELATSQQQFREWKAQLMLSRLTVENVDSVSQKIFRPAWPELMAALGRSLPQGVWLEKVSIDGDGHLLVTGPSLNEDGVFEFVRALKRETLLTDVALEGTQPAAFVSGPALRFEISARVAPRAGAAPENRNSVSGDTPPKTDVSATSGAVRS